MELFAERRGDHPEFTKVTNRLKYFRGNPTGTFNNDPMSDSRMDEVQHYDG